MNVLTKSTTNHILADLSAIRGDEVIKMKGKEFIGKTKRIDIFHKDYSTERILFDNISDMHKYMITTRFKKDDSIYIMTRINNPQDEEAWFTIDEAYKIEDIEKIPF